MIQCLVKPLREVSWEPTDVVSAELEPNSIERIGCSLGMDTFSYRFLVSAYDSGAPGGAIFTIFLPAPNLGLNRGSVEAYGIEIDLIIVKCGRG